MFEIYNQFARIKLESGREIGYLNVSNAGWNGLLACRSGSVTDGWFVYNLRTRTRTRVSVLYEYHTS